MSTSTTGMNDDLQRLTLEQDALLVEARRRLAVRDRIDNKRRIAQRQAERHRIEERVLVESKHTGEMAMTKLDRPTIPSKRLPASGNSALAASALIQAALGLEFTLSGLNKLANPHYVANFNAFVRSTPGLVGAILLIGAVEIGRRRFSGRLGAQHGYEAPVALVSALAGLAAAGLALSIGMLMGEGLPAIMPGRDLTTAIPVELLIVPLGIAIAWLELGRFLVLRRVPATSAMTSGRPDQQPQAA
ncbi:MAG: hypothetical protein E6I68_01760 [Chloroflexi bacterium]|nr:MAG: hypothetical protein E6I68_01760 [Chloroflexota bacterium]